LQRGRRAFTIARTDLVQYPAGKRGAYGIPTGVTNIMGWAFEGCAGLTAVTIPDSVKSIGNGAFYWAGLTSVTIPDGVTTIGDSAFYRCGSLLTAVVGPGVTNIGDLAFGSCTNLHGLYFKGDPPSLGIDYIYYGWGTAFPGTTSTVYHVSGTAGWETTYGGLTTAVWTAGVTFAAGAGTPSYASRTYNVGNAYGELPAANLSGHVFSGWRTEPDGGGTVVATNTPVPYATEDYTLYALWSLEQVATPSISPTNGTVFTTSSKRVTITCATSGAEIRFTTNGVDPAASSDLYSGSFNIYATTTVKARAFKSGMTDSEIAVSVVTKPLTITLADALDVPAWTVSTGGDAAWTPEVTLTHDGSDAVRTGAIGASQTTWVETSVTGAGTLTFWWRSSCEDSPDNDWDYLSFTVDGVEKARIDGSNAWQQVSATLASGSHTLRWTYSKDDADEAVYEDCGWVDQIVWTPAGGSTTTTLVPVPYTWLDQFGLATGGNYETAANLDADGDGFTAWQEYVAGTVPTNGLSLFEAMILMSNGVPFVTWTPDLGTARLYTVEGKASLTNAAWSSPTNAATRFFRVKVSLK